MKYQILNIKNKISSSKDLIKILLKNRGIKTAKEIEEFLHPKLETVTTKSVGIDEKELLKAIARIKLAIKNKEQIVVFGDYDVDGICGTAILWETLNSLGAKVMPYIPHRIGEGYGLSIKGIENCKLKNENCSLIITVDNGIVANEAVDFANKNKIDVIVTDHHVVGKKLPNALAIVHTTKLCGAGVAYLLSNVILNEVKNPNRKIDSSATPQNDTSKSHLELVALATVADLVPLKGANRKLLKFGLEQLRKTQRIGLLELFKEAGITKENIGVYEIGHIIAPRLNATGRLEYAMDSLRLLCTTNQKRAEKLATEIGLTNKQRQQLTIQTTEHAIESVKNKKELKELLIVVHESYEQESVFVFRNMVEKRIMTFLKFGTAIDSGCLSNAIGKIPSEMSNHQFIESLKNKVGGTLIIATEKTKIIDPKKQQQLEELKLKRARRAENIFLLNHGR